MNLSAVNVLKSKFYPVDITRQTIFDDPLAREIDVARKYRGRPVTGIKGSRLLEFRCYQSYTVQPVEPPGRWSQEEQKP